MLAPSNLRMLSCMTVVILPYCPCHTAQQARIKAAGDAPESAARCFYSYEKGRHIAGPAHGEWRLVDHLIYGYFSTCFEWYIAIARSARGSVFITNTTVERAFNGLDDIVLHVVGA